MSTPRIADTFSLAPSGMKAMMALEASFAQSGFDPVLMELVRLRVSQINGCAYCIHLHASDLIGRGVDAMRLHLLPAWRDASLYSNRERAALAWAEALTLLPQNGASDEDYAILAGEFTEAEQVQLTLLIGSINSWNRLQAGFRASHPA
jgi:AhpD family alkylhydroperoxidase